MIWLKRALDELRLPLPCGLRCDNTASIDIAENPKVNDRTKHIDVKYHYTREQLLNNEFDLMYVSTTENLADICTKPLGRSLHHKFATTIRCDR
jgi:hypothetical protein